MRTLFSKIFLSFWLSHLLVVVLLFSVLLNALERRVPRDAREIAPVSGAVLALQARESVAAFERGGQRALDSQLDRLRVATELSAALLEVSSNSKRRINRVNRKIPGNISVRNVSSHSVPSRGEALAILAAGSGEVEFAPMGPNAVAARPIRDSRGRLYIFVARSRPDDGGLLGTRRLRFEAARLFAVLIGAAVVAWGLANYFSTPIARLRRATHQLAEGDLSARVGPQIGRGRDELSELGHDFDLMAGRMEELMLSERRLLASERRQAEAQRRLLADISHELRSPLARIAFALELAAGAGKDFPKYLERIERESSLLNEMIGQLLTLARLESGADVEREHKVDLAELMLEVCDDADFEAQRRGCHVRAQKPDACLLAGAPDLLRSAVENVVRNAVRYTSAGTTVEVSLTCSVEEAVIRVRDFGPGVPEAALGEMFRPFYRVEDARDRNTGGVGLGLSITERAARLHGGTVRASNVDGGGLEIEIRLPLALSPSTCT